MLKVLKSDRPRGGGCRWRQQPARRCGPRNQVLAFLFPDYGSVQRQHPGDSDVGSRVVTFPISMLAGGGGVSEGWEGLQVGWMRCLLLLNQVGLR